MAILSMQHGTKFYEKHMILQDIKLTIAKGDIVGLIGKSGSGVSTLLQCLSQIEYFDSGMTSLFGENITHKPKAKTALPMATKNKVGMIFQDYCLWPHMPVLDNLILAPTHTLKMDKAEAICLAQSLLAKFNLENKALAYSTSLSGGQKQKVAIARCLMMSPELILMDEPTAALDPSAIKDLIHMIKHLNATGITFVIASHEIGFIQSIADEVMFMQDGHLIEHGPIDIINQPTTTALKAFTDSMLIA